MVESCSSVQTEGVETPTEPERSFETVYQRFVILYSEVCSKEEITSDEVFWPESDFRELENNDE